MKSSLIHQFYFRPKTGIKHHITKGGSGSTQSPTFAPSSPNSPDDMNSSLLRPTSDVENNYIFGKFKGFTMKPLPGAIKVVKTPKVAYVHPVTKTNNDVDLHIVPTREAPPPPVLKHQGVNAAIDKFNHINATSGPPALPPLNKGSTARPIISQPILEASTCDAKEVPTIVKYPTIRRAPGPPKAEQKTVAFEENIVPDVLINPTSTIEKKPKDGTLSRIQSFLKKEPNNKPEKVHKQLKVIDKDKLKDLQISSPILITQVSLKDDSEDDNRTKLKRAQSMRDPPSPPVAKPQITSFGSMRQPRPKSIVDRPTLPPPPRPPAPVVKAASLAQPETSPNEYDESPVSPDNIYAVIEESPKSPPGPKNQKGSIESMGLLSEIVNEIEHRNFDSIYIASTLKKKKPGVANYANTKSVEEEYSGDAGSTTSSGYMRPIGAPIARIPPSQSTNKIPSTTSSNSVSSFKSAKSSDGSLTSPKGVTSPDAKTIKFDGPLKKTNSDLTKKPKEVESEYKAPKSNKPLSDDKKAAESTIGPRRPSLKKQVTPPTITLPKKVTTPNSSMRKRSPSPTKPPTSITKVPSKPKTLQKPTVEKAPVSSAKPTLKTSSSLSNGSVKSPVNPLTSSTTKQVMSAAANKKSNVAALQQKFETSKS